MGGPSIFGASIVDLARCLQSSGDAACFSGARPVARAAVAGATAPGAPGNLVATASGSSVTLTWSALASGDPVVTYIIEAGSASGLANLANFPTNSTATTFSAGGVPNGTYYVRLKAQNVAGTSGASNEATLVVGAAACSSAPDAPGGLAGTVSGGTVTLSWSAPSGGCAATSYVLQAGSAPGLSNLANAGTGTTATIYVATAVPAGTYYVRVRAQNANGQSGPSNEATVTVAPVKSPIVVVVTPNPVPFSGQTTASCGSSTNTWFYNQTIQDVSGAGATVLHRTNYRDGQVVNDFSSNFVIAPGGSFNFGTTFHCLSDTNSHVAQTIWTGTDASGSSFSYTGPLVTLEAKPGSATVDIQPRSATLASPPLSISHCQGGSAKQTFTITAPSNVTWSFRGPTSVSGSTHTYSMVPASGTGNGTVTLTILVGSDPSPACRDGSDVSWFASFDILFSPSVAGTSVIAVEVKYYVR